jgi:GT2 family glycosyltransferase
METPRLSVIVVYYNAREHVSPCVQSVLNGPGEIPFEIIVVDNASPEPPPGDIESGSVRMIRAERNEGYAAGCNLGWNASLGEFLFFLNPDTEVRTGSIPRMVEFLDRHERAAAVSGRIVNPGGEREASVFEFPNPWSSIGYGVAGMPARIPFLRRRLGRWLTRYHDPTETCRVDWMTGCAMMVRRKALEEVGGWDESYFLYAEEIDLYYRLRRAGWEAWYVADADIVHRGGGSSEAGSELSFIQPYLSRFRFVERYEGTKSEWVFRLVTALKQAAALVYDSLLLFTGSEDRPKIRQRIRARGRLIRFCIRKPGAAEEEPKR